MNTSMPIRGCLRRAPTRPVCHPRRFLLFAAALVALLLAVPAGALAAASGPSRSSVAASSRSQLVPVWAYINGKVPIAGGQTRIVTRGATVRQANRRLSSRTNAQGVVLLAFRRVPRHFTVIVTGGRARGRRLTGSQRTRVDRYPGAAAVVEVNPLTTVLARLRYERPRLSAGRAALIVKRYYRIPAWADLAQNLRSSRGWFNAQVYLHQAGRYGSVDRLTRVVVWRMLHGVTRMPYVTVRGPGRVRSAEATARIAGVGSAAATLVGKVFGNLLGTALEIKKQEIVGGALGGLLQLVKTLGLDLTSKSEIDGVRAQLDGLTTQITELKGKVDDVTKRLERINASNLLTQSNDIIASIKHAQEQLALLARLTPSNEEEKTRQKNLAATITTYIGNKLIDAPTRLNLQLSPELAIGDNVFKATSRALAASERFFDARDSDAVDEVYQYFATYQAQLAVLLANYYNANPDTYGVTTTRAVISQIEHNVMKVQTKSLKPRVPDRTFIDTRTPKFMWGTQNQTVNARKLLDQKLQTRNTIRMGYFSNYQMPAAEDLRNLVQGATGDPRAWLQAQINVSLAHQLLWVSQSVTTHRAGIKSAVCTVKVTVFDLATGKLEQHGYGNSAYSEQVPDCRLNDSKSTRFLESKSGGLLLLRYLAPGESYWW